MKLGVFIDIDQVVTQEPINMFFARQLGPDCEESYRLLDDEYHRDGMTSETFNARFIPIFRKYGMNREFCEAIPKDSAEYLRRYRRLRDDLESLIPNSGEEIDITKTVQWLHTEEEQEGNGKNKGDRHE